MSRREDPTGKDPLGEWGVVVWRLPWLVVVVLGTFVFWHSGARAAALCERERFVRSGSFSLWPPGARCTYGEPALHDTLLNPWFVGAVFAVIPLALLFAEWLSNAVRGPGRRLRTSPGRADHPDG
jgi:hypothetical protein